jgi:ABC-type transport system involved in multi-copper enzyme maturation permease subunit
MSAPQTIFTIGRYEAKLISRSWGFRIFSGLTLAALTLIMVTLTIPAYSGFYFSRALSGAFPLIVIKLLNVFQGIMAIIIGTDFLKRDRKQDTTEVIYAHPFANGEYILGKFAGIFGIFAVLDILILAIAAVIHIFFSRSLFAGSAYLLYIALLSLPTLAFMIGLTIFIGSLIRSQAAVYLLTLSYVFISLIVVGPSGHFILDGFGFHTPVLYSDFIGLGNLPDLILLRGAYLFLGLGLALGSTLLMKRLKQSSGQNRIFGFAAIFCAALAFVLGAVYLRGKAADEDFRAALKAESREPAGAPAMTLESCNIRLRHEGKRIAATADLALVNNQNVPLKTTTLSLNPGLLVSACRGDAGALTYKRRHHLLTVEAGAAIEPGGRIRLSVSYAGTIDERYCYLDIDDAIRDEALRIWFVTIPKRYAVVSPEFVHLTPECGWYPRPGLPESLLFPSRTKRDFTRYTLTVTVPAALTAVSQGTPTASDAGGERQFVFQPETPLPQLSLTVGRYDQKSVTVDGVRYGLYLLAGHDRFTSNFKDISGDLPQLIKQIKDGYEIQLGLNYPYKQFSLVETPIQVTSLSRPWTMAQEQVQPQIVFLPEMGVFCANANFLTGVRIPGQSAPAGARRAGAGRGGADVSPKDIQRQMFNLFVQSNLIATQSALALLGGLQRAPLGLRIDSNFDAGFNIYPNFLTYASHFDIAEWPLFGYSMETYLRERVVLQAGGLMRIGLGNNTVQEEINKFLLDHSLSDALRPSGRVTWPEASILQEKGKALLILIRAKLGTADFDERLLGFLKDHRFQSISRKAVEDFFARMGRLDLDKTIASWYLGKGLPGFVFDDVESYRVLEGEKTKFQIKFQVANPTDVEGVIKINLALRGGGARGGMGGGMGLGALASAQETRTVLLPPQTVKEVGIVLDQASAMTTIDTSMSRNLPGVFTLPFSNQQPRPGIKAFDGESARPYVQAPPGADGEYTVDNVDAGFMLPEKGRENWLRNMVRGLFVPNADEGDSVALATLRNPPDYWEPIISQNFYGRFVRSAYVKKSGQGASKVVWTVNLSAAGTYNIYFYHEGMGAGMGRGGNVVSMMAGRGFAPQAGGQPSGGQRGGGMAAGGQASGRGMAGPQMQPGKKHFLIHHDGKVEEVVVDLKDMPIGWTLIGSYPLAAGENRIELTDKNEERFVLADAVKWVQQR